MAEGGLTGGSANGKRAELPLSARCRMVMTDAELGDLLGLWCFGAGASRIGGDERRRLGDQLSVREGLIGEAIAIRETATMTGDEFAAWTARADKIIRLAWFVGTCDALGWLEAADVELEAKLADLGARDDAWRAGGRPG